MTGVLERNFFLHAKDGFEEGDVHARLQIGAARLLLPASTATKHATQNITQIIKPAAATKLREIKTEIAAAKTLPSSPAKLRTIS